MLYRPAEPMRSPIWGPTGREFKLQKNLCQTGPNVSGFSPIPGIEEKSDLRNILNYPLNRRALRRKRLKTLLFGKH